MNMSLAEFETLVLVNEMENEFFRLIHQYVFDLWIAGIDYTEFNQQRTYTLNLAYHIARIYEKHQTNRHMGEKIDVLMHYLNIRMFPTNVQNYIYNVSAVITYYVFHHSLQIVKTVQMQIQNFHFDSLSFDMTSLLSDALEPIVSQDDDFEEIIFFQDMQQVPTPLAAISLECRDSVQEEKDVCAICLSDDMKSYIHTNCGHSFCDCIMTHCLQQNTCPMCRQTVDSLIIYNKNYYRIMHSCLKYNNRFVFSPI